MIGSYLNANLHTSFYTSDEYRVAFDEFHNSVEDRRIIQGLNIVFSYFSSDSIPLLRV